MRELKNEFKNPRSNFIRVNSIDRKLIVSENQQLDIFQNNRGTLS